MNDPRALDEVLALVARHFGMLADVTRLKILHLLCEGELPVSELVVRSGCTQSNVSRNLGLMHQTGIVARRKVGSRVLYRITDLTLTTTCQTVCDQIAGRLDGHTELRQRLRNFHRPGDAMGGTAERATGTGDP